LQVLVRTPLEIRYAKSQGKLSATRKKMLGMILENPGDTFFLSSRGLTKRYEVDAATIVRTVQDWGMENLRNLRRTCVLISSCGLRRTRR
jgi:DNA-binding MurR/RpiR family transcriptional regulator